jgi:hypothetical protein
MVIVGPRGDYCIFWIIIYYWFIVYFFIKGEEEGDTEAGVHRVGFYVGGFERFSCSPGQLISDLIDRTASLCDVFSRLTHYLFI